MTIHKYDVGILGWWYGKNYGSIFTYYGLNRAIEGLGHSVLMVHEATGYNGYRVQWPDDILSMEFARRVGYKYTSQEHYSKLPKLNDEVKNFVVGSDQLWNPRIGRVNDDLFLDFVGPNNGRIAYATSFGNRGIEKFKPDFIEKHQANLKKFIGISVREDYAIDTAKDVFDVKAVQVVDPVILLPQRHYVQLAEKSTYKPSGDYLAVFFLDATEEKRNVAVSLADKLGLEKIVVIPNPDGGRKLALDLFKDPRFELMVEDTPENFLYTYNKASYIVTDSFHGSVFSVIFEKPFSSIYNRHRGADRFESLMSSLGFDETRRIYEVDTDVTIQENKNVTFDIDFSRANKYLEEGRRKSMEWLKDSLDKETASAENIAHHRSGRPIHVEQMVERPNFEASNSAWKIVRSRRDTKLSVSPSGAIRGNYVWCDLPDVVVKGSHYRFTIKWRVKTSGNAINLHLRNPETKKFISIGAVSLRGITIAGRTINPIRISLGGRNVEFSNYSIGRRTDMVEFKATQNGFTQFMLGAVHFSGPNAGAEIESIALEEILAANIKPVKKAPTHAEISYALSVNDNKRFAAAHTKSVASRDTGAWRARMMFHAHAVEKGLSHSNFRSGFGKISVPALAKEMNGWWLAGHDTNDQFFQTSASVMNSYFERHKALNSDVSSFWQQFNTPVQGAIKAATDMQGGVLTAGSDRETLIDTSEDPKFLDIIYGRRSVREFTSQPVSDDEIAGAVRIAMQAPSVCNRQTTRVHQIDDPKLIKEALKLQGGFGGYALPPRILLVTSDLRSFLFAAERNQPFVDGGLFMMALLLGLTKMGLGSCSLNTAMNTERENKIRNLLGVPEHEVFIAFIAVGHYDRDILVPRSKRIAVDQILVRHGRGK